MKAKIFDLKLVILIVFSIITLSSCSSVKVHNESVDRDNPEINYTDLIAPGLEIDDVLYKGQKDKSTSSVTSRRFSDDNFDKSNEMYYLAKFEDFEKTILGSYDYYYRIGSSKNDLIKLALQNLIEDPYTEIIPPKYITVDIKNFEIKDDISFLNSRFIQNLEIEFSYKDDDVDFNFVSKSIDTLYQNKPNIDHLNRLVYSGIYKCADQFINAYRNMSPSDSQNKQSEQSDIITESNSDNNQWPQYTQRNNSKIRTKRYIPHPRVRIGGYSNGGYTYGGELSINFGISESGHFTPAATLRVTNEYFSLGFTPMFYLDDTRTGFYLLTGVEFMNTYSETYYYTSYYGRGSNTIDSYSSINGVMGLGFRAGIIDFRLAAIGSYRLGDSGYKQTESDLLLGVSLCF